MEAVVVDVGSKLLKASFAVRDQPSSMDVTVDTVVRGFIKDGDAVEDLLHHVLYTGLGWEMGNEGQILFMDPLATPKVITTGKERYTIGEALFQPSMLGLEAHGIVEQLVRIISTLSYENHRQLLESTILYGSTSSMTGFEHRFKKEASLCSSAIRPMLVKPPEYIPENLKLYSAWVGGAILAKVLFPQNQHVTKADYDETGPAVVHSKCF